MNRDKAKGMLWLRRDSRALGEGGQDMGEGRPLIEGFLDAVECRSAGDIPKSGI